MRAKNAKDQCEAATTETHWKREKELDLRCPFIARVTVGKKRLCNRHAQVEALAILVGNGMANIIPRPQAPIPYQPVAVHHASSTRSDK